MSLSNSKAAGAGGAYARFPSAEAAAWRALWDGMQGACSTSLLALGNINKSASGQANNLQT